MIVEFIFGVMAGIILTLAIQNVLDNHRANEIRDNTIQMSKMEQRILLNVKHLMQKSKEEK